MYTLRLPPYKTLKMFGPKYSIKSSLWLSSLKHFDTFYSHRSGLF